MGIARLRYFPSVLRSAPTGLRVVLDYLWDGPSSWVGAIRDDVVWLNRLVNKLDVPRAGRRIGGFGLPDVPREPM